MAVNARRGEKTIMAKLIVSMLIVVTITLLFTGCQKRLTEEEYLGQVKGAYEEYAAALEEFESVRADVGTSQEIMEEQTKATEICDRAEEALNKFSKMNPPDSFPEKHKELLAAAELEIRFIKAQKKVLSAKTPDELSEYSAQAGTVFSGVPEEKQLPAVIGKLLKEIEL